MLSVLLPSRGRPEACQRAYASCVGLAEGEIEVLVYVDSDDDVEAYKQRMPVHVGPPLHSSQALLELHKLARGDSFFWGSDDFTWMTKGWDVKLRKSMPAHGLAIVCPDDGRGGTPPFFTTKWVEAVGVFPDYFVHFGPDQWLANIAERAGVLIKVPDVKVEHVKLKDETARRARAFGDAEFARQMLKEQEDERQRLAEIILERIRLCDADQNARREGNGGIPQMPLTQGAGPHI